MHSKFHNRHNLYGELFPACTKYFYSERPELMYTIFRCIERTEHLYRLFRYSERTEHMYKIFRYIERTEQCARHHATSLQLTPSLKRFHLNFIDNVIRIEIHLTLKLTS